MSRAWCSPLPTRGAAALERTADLLACAVLGASAWTVAWRLGAAWAAGPPPGAEAMQALTAAWLAGIASTLLARRCQAVFTVASVACLATAACAALLYLTNDRSGAGRSVQLPPPVVVFGGVLLGAALALLRWPRSWEGRWHAVRACAAAGVMLLAAGFGLEQVSPRGSPLSAATIAPLTLALACACAVALALLPVPARQQAELERFDRSASWATALLAGAVLMGWVAIEEDEWRERRRDGDTALQAVTQSFIHRLDAYGGGVARLANRWRIYGPPSDAA